MAKQQTNSQQMKTDSYANTSWNIHKVGTLRIATRKLTWTNITAGASVSTSFTLPDSKTFNDVSMTYGVNNNSAYVEYITFGTQFGDTGTNASMWARNYGAGTTGKITITMTAIYEA